MAARNGTASAERAAERELIITRVFDAPRELVFNAWTEPERLVRWWGPEGWTTPFCKIDLRCAGVWHWCQRSPEGRDFGAKASIAKSSSRSGSCSPFSSRTRKATSSSLRGTNEPGLPFTDVGDGHVCRARRQNPAHRASDHLESIAERLGAGLQFWNGSFDRLAGYVANT
jgi:hypothetical protein